MCKLANSSCLKQRPASVQKGRIQWRRWQKHLYMSRTSTHFSSNTGHLEERTFIQQQARNVQPLCSFGAVLDASIGGQRQA